LFKSIAYVSTAREVSQPTFIAHLFCKASLVVNKIIAESMNFYSNSVPQDVGAKKAEP
jgi:hypothetical protein